MGILEITIHYSLTVWSHFRYVVRIVDCGLQGSLHHYSFGFVGCDISWTGDLYFLARKRCEGIPKIRILYTSSVLTLGHASISVYLIVGFLVIVARGLFYPSLLILLTPLMAYILDVVVLQSRIRLEYRYSLFWSALNLAYTVIALIVLGFSCQNCVHIGYGTPIAVLVLIQILVGYIASIIAVWLTRIPWPCLVKT